MLSMRPTLLIYTHRTKATPYYFIITSYHFQVLRHKDVTMPGFYKFHHFAIRFTLRLVIFNNPSALHQFPIYFTTYAVFYHFFSYLITSYYILTTSHHVVDYLFYYARHTVNFRITSIYLF